MSPPRHPARLDWHKTSNARLRCLRITTKEEKAVRGKLQAGYQELEVSRGGGPVCLRVCLCVVCVCV